MYSLYFEKYTFTLCLFKKSSYYCFFYPENKAKESDRTIAHGSNGIYWVQLCIVVRDCFFSRFFYMYGWFVDTPHLDRYTVCLDSLH